MRFHKLDALGHALANVGLSMPDFVLSSGDFAPTVATGAIYENGLGTSAFPRAFVTFGPRIKARIGRQQLLEQRLAHGDGDYRPGNHYKAFSGKPVLLLWPLHCHQ